MHNRFTLAALLSSLVLMGTLMAGAQATGVQTQTSPQSQTGPQSSNPASPSAATSPNAAAAGQSSGSQTMGQQPQSSSPAATPGQAGSNAPQGHPGSVEEELQLTPDQKAKLQPIIQEEVDQINQVRNDTSMSMDQKRAKVQQIKQTSFPKILAVLTPEQQKKLSDMQQRARTQAQQQQQMNQSPSSTGQPDASQSPSGPGSTQPGMQRPGQSGMGQPGATPGMPPASQQPPH